MHAILIAGAALVGLPILLHLIMKQEPKRLTFPAFRFLTQKLKTNQRKLRLRHFILLALRMLLIALFCLALYQPTLKSDRLNIRGEQPVATVLVIDTSPSMGYTANNKTALEEVRRRALELLDELPEKSPVAVVTTDDPTGYWGDVADARKQVEGLDKPRGGSQSVTAALAQAYQLLSAVEARDAEEAEQLPKLVAVLTDRAAASWDPARVEDLKKLRDSVPGPKPAHAVIDVGAEKPVNVGILSAEMKPQVISANQPATVIVTVAATGPPDQLPVEAVVLAKLDGSEKVADRRPVAVPYGQSKAVTFEFRGLKPGLRQVQFELETPDKLMFDNTRFLSFKVGEARRMLTVADDPAAAVVWQLALDPRVNPKSDFNCLVVRPPALRVQDGQTLVTYPDPEKPDKPAEENLRGFDVVCLLSVRDPGEKNGTLDNLWDCVRPYVQGGGKLLVIPGGDRSADGYAAGTDLMPGTLAEVVDTRTVEPAPPGQKVPGLGPTPADGRNGVTWFLDERVTQHPMLRPFRTFRAEDDVVKFPRRTRKYWRVDKAADAAVVVRYDSAERDADRHPAVLERGVPADPKEPAKVKGRVVLLTTKMEPTDLQDGANNWHNYWDSDSSWGVVFPWLLARYLAGDAADANFNFPVGQPVTVPLPKGGLPRGTKVVVDNRDLPSADSLVDVGDRQTELRVGPPRVNHPGNFRLSAGAAAPNWVDGFGLNVPAEEGTLEKVPAEGVEDLTGKGTVFPLDRNLKLRDVIPVILDQPVDLFPWLLILVLLLLAAEGLVANRFYRRVR